MRIMLILLAILFIFSYSKAFEVVQINPSTNLWIVENYNEVLKENLSVKVNCDGNLTSFVNGTIFIHPVVFSQNNLYTIFIPESAINVGSYKLYINCNENLTSIDFVVNKLSILPNDLFKFRFYESEDVIAYVNLLKNNNPLIPEDAPTFEVYLDNQKLQGFSYWYDRANNYWAIPIGKLSLGNHELLIIGKYDRVQAKLKKTISIEKEMSFSIESISKNYVKSNEEIDLIISAIYKSSPLQINPSNLKIQVNGYSATVKSINFLNGKNYVKISLPNLESGNYNLVATLDYNGIWSDSKPIYYTISFSGSLDSYAEFYFYKNDNLIQKARTNQNNNYNIDLPKDIYNLKIDFLKAFVEIVNLEVNENLENKIKYNYFDNVNIDGINVYSLHYFEIPLKFSLANLYLSYDESKVLDENKIKVFVCENFNPTLKVCSNNWLEVKNFEIDKIKNLVKLKVEKFSAFLIGNNLNLILKCSYPDKVEVKKTYTISCFVKDDLNNAVKNAKVSLSFNGNSYVAFSGENGIVNFDISFNEEGEERLKIDVSKYLYNSYSIEIKINVEKSKELFISFPENLKFETGKSYEIKFSITNTGQADLFNLYLEVIGIPEKIYSFDNFIKELKSGESKELKISFEIPENYSESIIDAKLKIYNNLITKEKSFSLTILKSSLTKIETTGLPIPNFLVPKDVKVDKNVLILSIIILIFAAIYKIFIKSKRYRKGRKTNYEDIISFFGKK